jgi:hypothetical protein
MALLSVFWDAWHLDSVGVKAQRCDRPMHVFLYNLILDDGDEINGMLDDRCSHINDAIAMLNRKYPTAVKITIRKLEKEKHAELRTFKRRREQDHL